MRALVSADYFEPGFRAGGPIRTLAHILEAAGATNDVRIVTRAHDLGITKNYPGIKAGEWVPRKNYHVWYTTRSLYMAFRLLRTVRRFDPEIYYLNSYFSGAFSRLPMLLMWLSILPRRPILLAPRGELFPAALAQNRRKKSLTLLMGDILGLDTSVTWQATSPDEANAIRRTRRDLGDANILVSPDMLPSVSTTSLRPKSSPTRFVFMSRISPIKNLHELLLLMPNLVGVLDLDIYGPTDASYWLECRRLLSTCPNAHYRGVAEGASVSEILASYDYFVLPSSSESFGHAIMEALVAGTPVVITNTNPWADVVAGLAGFVVGPHDALGLEQALRSAANASGADYERMQNGCAEALRLFASQFADSVVPGRLFDACLALWHA
jgi:glycosyltransferase involved in cell wall biosynthesis